MEKLDKDTLKSLQDIDAELAVTIYAPMHTSAAPPHISENQIRFKNLLQKAADEIRGIDKHAELAMQLESTIDEIYNSLTFWENQTPGLLICATTNNIHMFHLPIDTEEYVAVDTYFHLAPVVGLLHDAREYYVLAIAQQNPKLYRGDMYSLESSGIELPANMREALNLDEPNRKTENQGTTTGPSSQGMASSPSRGRGWFNGRGGARNPAEADRLRFFRLIDQVIRDNANRDMPLILAGVESDIAEYREISRYPHILRGAAGINHTGTDDLRPLFEEAMTIISKELIEPAHQSAVEEYERVGGANPDRVARDLKSIDQAATQGRIDKLLAGMIRRTADTVRDTAGEVLRISFPNKSESKRLNDIARKVWQSSGTIFNLLPSEMPGGLQLAARLRY
jgi:hypothetical protein